MEDNGFTFERPQFEQELIGRFNSLKTGQRRAILWLIGCMDILERLDSGQIMTEAEEESWRKRARALKDDTLMVLVEYKKWKDQKRAEKSSPDGEPLHNS